MDSSLNERGQQQAKALFDAYQGVPFELVVTSDLDRTQETAQRFIDTGIAHVKDGGLDEICWGIHEGKSSNPEMKQDYLRLMSAWKAGDYSAKIEGGESAQDLADRLGDALNRIKQRLEANILILTHGRSIRCLMCLVEGIDIKHMDVYQHNNTGVYKVKQKGDQLELVNKNNIDHLKDIDS